MSINKPVPQLKPRILLVEDDVERINIVRQWLGNQYVLIEASSGGRAMGILRKNMTEGIAGVMLDHDLEKQVLTDDDMSISGTDLINAITTSIRRQVPILIHSMNLSKSPAMVKRLTNHGYSVTRIKMEDLTKENFREWLEDVSDQWEDRV